MISLKNCFVGPQLKSPMDSNRRRKRRYGSSWARGEIKTPRKKRFVEKDSLGKKEMKNDHDEVKTTEEEEVDEVDSQKTLEDDVKGEGGITGHSVYNSDEGRKLSEDLASEAKEKSVQVRNLLIVVIRE